MSPEKKEYKALFFGFNRFEQARIHKLFSRVRPDVLLLSASTKQKAHALLKQELISVVFIQTSAKKNGFAFLQDINTGETRIPTVLVTDPRDAGAALKAFERGAYECLPCEKNVIRHFPAALDRALARHHYRKFANAQEWAIIQSRREWITIIDAITDYIFITDDQCKLVKMNLAFSSEFGSAHPRSLIGSTCVGIFGDDTPCTNCRKKSEGTVFDTVDKRLNDNVYQHSTFPLSIDEKSFSVHVMKNITEMRKLKDRLYSSDKLASLGSLVAGVAHEINNPLTGIIAYAELLRMNPLADKVDAELKKILHNAERCKKIVENLLTFSRQKAPAKSIESLNDILDRTIELRTYWHRAGNIEIVREYGESLAVFVDSQQMQLVVMNILMNSEQAILDTGRGKGRIVIRTSHDRTARRMKVRITDNGTGIPKDIVPKVFDPFFTTKPVGIGSGLGLSIAHGIVIEHGGTIWVESKPESGTDVFLELPTGAGAILSPG